MLGVFKRRWKPKRIASDAIRPAGSEGRCASPERLSARQVHPLTAEPNQLHAYDQTLGRKPPRELADHTAPNICVQGGRIEFVKRPLDGDPDTTSTTPDCEKYDGDKEALEERIRQLEQRLEAEASNAQRDRLAVARLQQQLAKREEGVSRDVEVERSELRTRLAHAEHEAERANARLRAAHRELTRMEETVRSLLQYKSCVETLKQEKSSLSAALEARSIHYQTSLSKLSLENESLRAQVAALQEASPPLPPPLPPPHYERCLDDVANQVVRALLNQKGLRDELGRLASRARDLETQNRALGTLLLRQLKPKPAPSPASPTSPPGSAAKSSRLRNDHTPSTKNSKVKQNQASPSPQEPLAGHLPYNFQLKSFSQNLSIEKCLHKHRLCKSNNDISYSSTVNGSKSVHKNNCNKRLSDGNLTLPSSINDLYSKQSIISFEDEPLGDIMSVCVSHRAYQLSADDKRRHQILANLWTELKSVEVTPQSLIEALQAVDPSLWAPPERPLTLNLKRTTPIMLSQYLQRLSQTLPDQLDQLPVEDETVIESPESGNRDEGYSTMSSDVQIDPLRQGSETNRELEDLKEASDETDNQILLSINNTINMEDKTESDILYIPLNLAFNLNQRNSFPPSKNIFPFQHIMRSFSDSHLCLKLTASQYIENCFTLSSPLSSSPSIRHLDALPKDKRKTLLKRTKGTPNLLPSCNVYYENVERNSHDRNSWASNIDEQVDGCQYDAEYVQHWLKLDDTRSALQQQHRDLLEYDQTELEDWSLNFSYEDLRDENWKRISSFNDATTPGQISISTLPSIQENNALELEEDVSECLWNNSSYMIDNTSDKYTPLAIENELEHLQRSNWPYSYMGNPDLSSPIGSWSSIDNSEDCCLNSECFYNSHSMADNETSKRSSAIMSGCSDEPESSLIGTDFTRDFYRLVKFESTKSLASNSSKCIALPGNENVGSTPKAADIQNSSKQDREQALQNVLSFIAEQQKYCYTREELDSRPTSEIHELPPPFLETDISQKHINENATASSESESCDFIMRDGFNSIDSSNLNKNSQIIENQINSTEHNFFNGHSASSENETDEQYILKVHHKNEINKSIDRTVVAPSTFTDNSVNLNGPCRSCDFIEITHQTGKNQTAETNHLSTFVYRDAGSKDFERKKSTSGAHSSKNLLLEEVLKLSKRDCEPLITVLEEEESGMDNSFTHMSDSMTTSVSTTDTIATEIRTDKKNKNDKSKIPIPIQSSVKKISQISKKSKKTMLPISHKKNTEITAELVQSNLPAGNIIVCQGPSHSKVVSFHESATSKDVIDELNRMIRKGEENIGNDTEIPFIHHNFDKALWKPSGWVHVEKEIDFTDPKARANLLDVMLASSDSSPSSTSSCAGSFSSESSDDKTDYSKLHRLHRYRRQKKAAALKERGLAVLRFSCFHRPSIIGRDSLYVRYGKQEQDAVSCFDFLEEISTENFHFGSSSEDNAQREPTVPPDSTKHGEKIPNLHLKNSDDSSIVNLPQPDYSGERNVT